MMRSVVLVLVRIVSYRLVKFDSVRIRKMNFSVSEKMMLN